MFNLFFKLGRIPSQLKFAEALLVGALLALPIGLRAEIGAAQIEIFSSSDAVNFVCSASLVNKKVLLTAGHCVSDGRGNWHKNVLWAPGYLQGDLPFGVVAAAKGFVFSGWFNNSYLPGDFGFLVLSEPKGEELGWLGILTGGSPNGKAWDQTGYPAAPPYDGEKLTINSSAFGARDCRYGNPCTVAVGSPLTGGSSGGSWNRFYSEEHGLVTNGVNSYGYSSCNVNMYSPYFGSDVWNLYQMAVAEK